MFEYRFKWDPIKATSNWRKHGVSFDLAATVFNDPLMLSIPDEQHGGTEERWLTLGQAKNGILLVVVHAYQEISANSAEVRIISARRATRRERGQYETNL